MLDDDGFPTNAEYLQAQGLDLVSANRELVTMQTQLSDLQEFYAMLANPETQAQALADFNAALEEERGSGRTESYQRPAFPGHYNENQSNDPIQAWQRAREFGYPAGQEQLAQQLWGQVPPQLQARAILQNLSNL